VAVEYRVLGPLEATVDGQSVALGPPRNRALLVLLLSRELEARRKRLADQGAIVRAAAFISVAPGADLARLTREQAVELALVDAPDDLLEDARLLTLLEQAPCDGVETHYAGDIRMRGGAAAGAARRSCG
jgi:hypothetical protein